MLQTSAFKIDFKTFTYKSLWVIVFTLAIFAANLSSGDLRGDSMVYAAISKNILTLHSPLVMHFNDAIYLNKPPMLFWLTALSLYVFGHSIFAVNLVVAFSALVLNLAFFYWIARICKGYNLAYLSIFCLDTSYVIYKNSHTLKMEALTAFFIVMAMIFFWHYLKDKRLMWILGFGLMSGLAVMTKGFLGGIPWAIVIVYLLTPVGRDIRSRQFLLHAMAALLVFLASFLWWYVYISLRTDFLHHFLYDEVWARLVTSDTSEATQYKHKPVYRYLWFMLKDYFMYLPFFLYGCYHLYKHRDSNIDREGLTLLAIFTIFCFAVVHLISTRSERYLYEFFITAAFFSAYGISRVPKLKNVNFASWLKVMGTLYMLFILTTPLKLGWNSYTSLRDLQKLSDNMHVPIMVNKHWLPSYVDQAAVTFFLNNPPLDSAPKGSYFTILPREYQGPLKYKLVEKTRQLRIVLVTKSDCVTQSDD
ncbi:ArnT family glycosyltransferase [Celerinatantimonas diazotrophica]|uniref:ArnT family glycosyltransferase n=1 Tax=Celerinatantimonas diazotrophica TaxID=412034 RepID=UPI00104A72E9|nr:glycosyltransferase family 39 protein [Celerinatantimonas diazotrophica]